MACGLGLASGKSGASYRVPPPSVSSTDVEGLSHDYVSSKSMFANLIRIEIGDDFVREKEK